MNLLSFNLIAICSILYPACPPSHTSLAETLQTAEGLLFDTLDLQINGPCFDVAFYQDGIIFIKTGDETAYLTEMDRPDPEISRPLFANKEFSCSPAAFSFSSDKRRGYYSKRIVLTDHPAMEKIYEMSIVNNEVSEIRQLPFAGDSSRYLHPAISSDGSMMVFSSDRLPTCGGLDLFVTRKTAEGWSEPLHLGRSINSSGHEWYPFLDGRNNLWYSSSGHSGYGGYDIFICPYNGKDWEHPRNLGKSINGPLDELGMSIHPRNRAALFSRTESSGPEGKAIRISLPDSSSNKDISLVIQQIAGPAVAAESLIQAEPAFTPEPEILSEPVLGVQADPNGVVFRVQIISSLNPDSFPTVLIDGKSYQTFEYFYKGSYRITVGAFDSVKDANNFKNKCLSSGFAQAFVAAFRGDQRETDPSVFK
ncbi:MAG: hypothetical protein P1P86_12550 [Bacteroidales bacterium]|nr:hypothetical protein [Bacteroidales bacterium]